MKSKAVFILSLFISSIFAQEKHRLDINISYPLVTSDFPTRGLVSMEVKFNRSVKDPFLFLSLGPSFNLYQDFNGNAMNNFGLELGINKKIVPHPSIVFYPFLNTGYSGFIYSKDKISEGLKTELGINICNSNISHWIGLHLSYKHYFIDDFVYSTRQKPCKGSFGVLSAGIYFHL